MSPATTTQWSHTAAGPPRRSSHHEHLRRALLQDRDKQVDMLPGACVRRNGMIVDVSRTSLLPSPTRQSHRAARRLCSSQRHDQWRFPQTFNHQHVPWCRQLIDNGCQRMLTDHILLPVLFASRYTNS
ncbi:hypothetical protein MTO96_030215 [Rhipicephalus appendiculatus]